MPNLKRVAALAMLSGAFLGSTVLTTATVANAEVAGILIECGKTKNTSVRGGQASWTTSCANGKITIQGWVKDTRADGKCAQVYGSYGGGGTFESRKACPKDEIENFTRTGSGSSASVYLRVY